MAEGGAPEEVCPCSIGLDSERLARMRKTFELVRSGLVDFMTTNFVMMVCSCAPFDFNKVEMIVEGLSTGMVRVQVMKAQKGDD